MSGAVVHDGALTNLLVTVRIVVVKPAADYSFHLDVSRLGHHHLCQPARDGFCAAFYGSAFSIVVFLLAAGVPLGIPHDVLGRTFLSFSSELFHTP